MFSKGLRPFCLPCNPLLPFAFIFIKRHERGGAHRQALLAMKDKRALPALEMKIKKPLSYIPAKGTLPDKITVALRHGRAVTL